MITLSGAPVLAGKVSLPYVGAWRAALELGTDEQPSGQVDIDDGEGTTYRGTVLRAGQMGSRMFCMVVGGAGGLRVQQEPQHFRNTTVAQALAGILAAAEETQDPNIFPSSTSTAIGFWSTQQATGGANIASLCDEHDLLWRVRPSGVVWVGPAAESLEAPGEALVLDGVPAVPRFLCAPEGLWLQPGMQQSRGKVERVEYDLSDHLRATYWVTDG